MKTPRYWFPVRPASRGWGWGLPLVWQGWAVYAGFFAALIGGPILLAPYGQLATIVYSCLVAAIFVALVAWKGEPQHQRTDT
ncbi:hypothetical protein [Massilia sp. Leaf139]|uniref:hypothetical protein n=1 Tax=Massilia sp. Leaf139 TaxID=1736272 RepID=UPI0006F91580|nr:hypothetical protein [Massilia sp. Leaf139]KQQ87840.1 hypothetical protein ASF77_13980 [Massilia sp. Leaf139]